MAAAARCDAHVDQHPGVHRAQQFGDALGARRAVPERDQWHRPSAWSGGKLTLCLLSFLAVLVRSSQADHWVREPLARESQTTPATAPRMITAAMAISQVRIPKMAP